MFQFGLAAFNQSSYEVCLKSLPWY